MVEHRMVLSPWTATTLPAKTALFSRSNTSRRSASILIGSLPPPPKAPRGAASFLAAGAGGAPLVFCARAGPGPDRARAIQARARPDAARRLGRDRIMGA